MSDNKRCGFIAIMGRPNVGKSTLLNQILGTKISITCDKPQTTRHRVLGVKTKGTSQAVYVDTPGLHKKEVKALNARMNKAAYGALHDVDVIVCVCDARGIHKDDKWVLDLFAKNAAPLILVLNKIDQVKDKETLLPLITELNATYQPAHIVPISAKLGKQVDELQDVLMSYLPESEHFFEADQVTDKSMRFLVAEIMREKLMRNLGQELPYATTVVIEQFKETDTLAEIHALIWIEREGQKAIVLGPKGERMKKMAMAARKDMERLLGKKVMLHSWVKVKEGWTDDDAALNQFGYDPNA